MNPLITNANLGLRFLLELAALAAISAWGFGAGEGALANSALGIGVPVGAAAVWGVFRVPNDPGDAPVPVPGPVRLAIEVAVWGAATAGLVASGRTGLALAFSALVVISNALMHQRLGRLIRDR
ncbi:MAG: YrdB family protein [Chloroflexi bacterium]|nr:YrdB family protein [Chloroflexota bacterium]MDA1002173.1 YrdB family protein [Chloroflexota bacterium]